MDLDHGLLFTILSDRSAYDRLGNLGIESDDFHSPEIRKCFDFVVSHVSDHGILPTTGLVKDICGVEVVGRGDASAEFVVGEFLKRKLFIRLRGVNDVLQRKLQSNDPIGAYESLESFISDCDTNFRDANPHRVTDLGDPVLDIYDKVASGYTGIPFPWESMTDTTLGMWPGTSTYFIARPSIGKTWVAWLIAKHAWKANYRALVISPEMSKEEGAERFFVLNSGVSGRDFLRGELSDFALNTLKESVSSLKGRDGIWIVDGDDGLSKSSLDAYIRAVKPNLVAIDSAYMLPMGGKDRTENMMRAVSWIRESAKKYGPLYGTCFVAFHQLSRAAVKSKMAGGVGYNDAAIALTDTVLWDAYSVWIMEQDSDMRVDKRIKFHCSKVRRGIFRTEPVETMWDFDQMRFNEISASGNEFEDSEFSGKVPF